MPSPKIMTVREFKERFKVGDLILSGKRPLPMRITAIGDQRFLFREEASPNRNEIVAMMNSGTGKWTKFDPVGNYDHAAIERSMNLKLQKLASMIKNPINYFENQEPIEPEPEDESLPLGNV